MKTKSVLVLGDPHDADSGEQLMQQLDGLGLAARLVLMPGEAVWHVDAHDPPHAVIVDGDGARPDRFELLAHFREHHPAMLRLLVVSGPAPGVAGCTVVDRHQLPTVLASALGLEQS